MERKERVGGERKEKKLIEFLELMTLKGRVTWCLMVCPCPRISPGPVPSRSTSLGFADKPVLRVGLWVQRVTHLQDSTHHQSSLGLRAWPVCGGAGGQINGVSCKSIHVPKASTGKSTRQVEVPES